MLEQSTIYRPPAPEPAESEGKASYERRDASWFEYAIARLPVLTDTEYVARRRAFEAGWEARDADR